MSLKFLGNELFGVTHIKLELASDSELRWLEPFDLLNSSSFTRAQYIQCCLKPHQAC